MSDKIKKALAKLSPKERIVLESILGKIISNNLSGLDVKQLKGNKNIYRVRVGTIRVIFTKESTEDIKLLEISRRSEKTYKKY